MGSLRDKIASGTGSVLEWYDFSIYGFFAPLLAQIFFPHNSAMLGIIKSFGVFAVGFMARPIGALIFGYIADKHGRARCLKLTPLLITIPTLSIALLPSFTTIGVLSPILLLTLRILQGLCIGGEFSNNIVYLCESASIKNRYFMGSIGACTGSLGILTASTLAAFFYAFMSTTELTHYGWRIAFALSAALGIVTFYLRKNLTETAIFQTLENPQNTNPIIESIRSQKCDYLKAIGLVSFSATTFYFLFMFLPNYANNVLGIHAAKAFGNNSFSLLSRLLMIPFIGFITDKIGGLIMMRISCILFIIFSLPLFYLMVHHKETFFYCAYLLALLSTLNAASAPGILMDLLKPNTRCTIFSFTFNLCFGVFGGIVPVIGFYLANTFKFPTAPIYYLILSGIITLTVSFFVKNGLCHGE